MARAEWNGQIIADTTDTIIVEGNHYFPEDSIQKKFYKPSSTHTTCHWKGEASYFTLDVNGKLNPDAAWFYPDPKEAAKQIKNRVAFWKGVQIITEVE